MKSRLLGAVCACVICLLCGAVPLSTDATIVATLIYDEPIGVAQPNETIIINGTLTNILSSTENITTSFGGGFRSSFILSEYDFSEFDLPPDGKSLMEQFIGIDLAPSQSFRFVFGKFVPRDGTAAPGTYEIFTNQFGVGGPVTARQEINFSGKFTRTVDSIPVPEPSIAVLMASGLMIFGVARRKNRAK